MSEDWYSSPDFLERVRDFHHYHARQPTGEGLDRAKQILNQKLDLIRSEMQRQGIFNCSRFEHRGSTYEGVKVATNSSNPGLEFDIMFIIEGGTDLVDMGIGSDGYATLLPKPGKDSRPAFQKTMRNGCVSATETRNLFYGQLIKCNLGTGCTIRYHGPAVEIDVNTQGVTFSVDLAPHYDLTGQGKLFVAKAPKDGSVETRWFRSFSMDEKKKFDGMDRDNGCRKMVLRIVKVLRQRSSELSCLKSNQLKSALFRVVDRQSQWRMSDQLGVRLMDLLKQLEDDLTRGRMDHYYMAGVNLFEKFSYITMENMAGRIKRLRRNKAEMMELLRP